MLTLERTCKLIPPPWWWHCWGGCDVISNGRQYVLNSAAGLSRKRDHVAPLLLQLHWLPVDQRIEFKVLLFSEAPRARSVRERSSIAM